MANKRSASTPRLQASRDWSVGVRVSIERHGKPVLDEDTADLLLAVDRTHSISAAARALGISYRHAWLLIDAANESAGQPLVETAIGGKRGGGAGLTDDGRAALAVFQQVQAEIRNAAAKALPKFFTATDQKTSAIHLAAAISLQEVVAQVLGEYALVRPAIAVRTVFGASNELADQIAAGSSTDVFLSANREQIARLAKAGLVDRGSRVELATNSLAVVGEAALAGKLKKPADLRKLADRPLVVAEPDCPLGNYTQKFLDDAGLLAELRPRMTFADNSRAVVASVRAGGPQLGIIFGSDIANAAGLCTLLQIPITQSKAVYEGAALKHSSALGEAKALVDFFTSDAARRCFRRCGFTV